MKIIVCVKQVPATQNVKLDEETGALLRAGVKSKLNPYDLFAIEAALELRERFGGEVALLTMGPPQARKALTEGLGMGADRGALLCDARFAGSDVFATGMALSGAIRLLGGYDLILAGKQTTDGDTAQVGPEVAELLGIPHACNVTQVLGYERGASGLGGGDVKDLDSGGEAKDADGGEAKDANGGIYYSDTAGGGRITVEQVTGDMQMRLILNTPCLLSIGKDVNTPRLPSYKRGKSITDDMIVTLTLDDIMKSGAGADESDYGASGSPTRVMKVFPPPAAAERTMYEGSGEELGAALAVLLTAGKYIDA